MDQDAAIGTYRFGPSQIEHPPDHIEHMDAHIANDAIAIFHEGAPTTRVNDSVEGAHGSGTRPQIIIQIFWRFNIGCVVVVTHVVITVKVDMANFAQKALTDYPILRLD